MRRTILLAGVLLSVVALGSDSPKEYDDRTEVAGIDGTWRMVGNEKNVMTCHGGTWTIDGDGGLWQGNYRIDTTHKPAELYRYYANGPFMGQTMRFIYQIDGKLLRIANAPVGSSPPKGFNERGVRVYTYTRVR